MEDLEIPAGIQGNAVICKDQLALLQFVNPLNTMTGTSVRPSWRAAASRPWPAMTSPSVPIKMGLENPNARMLPAISAT